MVLENMAETMTSGCVCRSWKLLSNHLGLVTVALPTFIARKKKKRNGIKIILKMEFLFLFILKIKGQVKATTNPPSSDIMMTVLIAPREPEILVVWKKEGYEGFKSNEKKKKGGERKKKKKKKKP